MLKINTPYGIILTGLFNVFIIMVHSSSSFRYFLISGKGPVYFDFTVFIYVYKVKFDIGIESYL